MGRVQMLSESDLLARRDELRAQIGDVEEFADRAERFDLNAEERALFGRWRRNEYLLNG